MGKIIDKLRPRLLSLMVFYGYLIVAIGFLLMACSPSKMKLVDEYCIYSPDDFHETYYLKCKLSGGTDHEIDSLHTIYWNGSSIIMERGEGEKNWWLIQAASSTLKCCNNDIVKGPFSKQYIQKYLQNGKYKKMVLN